jgi:hypothetical protein
MDDSLLMCDSTEGDGKAEIVMDYVMSWSLRHAVTNETNEKTPRLLQYCRYMLHKLLQLKAPLEQIVFEKVEVWKEWKNMDLCVEVTFTNNGQREFYALLIENKYYSPLHLKKDTKGIWRNQVDVYKEIFEKHYNFLKKEERKYALVSCFESNDDKIRLYDEALKFGFKVFGFYDIINESYWDEANGKYEDSESDIFNEFWLRKW